MAKMFEDEEITSIITRFIQQDGYFVICYKLPKRIGEKVWISRTSKVGECIIVALSTREEALRQINRAGLNPADFSLDLLYFYRARIA